MTDQKVLVFGSFTEDEMKSLQRQAPENDSEIKFGSLDSATLRSVGIFNTKSIKLEESKARPSKLVNKENIVKIVCATENPSYTVATIVHENGVVISGSRGSGVSNPSKWSSPKRHGVENMTIVSKPKEKEVLIDLSNAVDLVDFTENIHQAPNGLSATVWNLLPRGLVNLGNLCFLNATLQALLSCSPFVLLLQELRTRNIPKIGYPALGAFVEFISAFEVPTVSSSQKRISVLETGRPFRPIMFESILKIFSPDVPNSILGWPRQEDAQEFLSFILDQMHDELLKHEGQFPRENGSLVLSVNDEDDDETWETVGPRSKTAITRMQSFIPSKLSAIFGGQLRSVVKARGNKASATIQPYLLLHLNICPDPVSTIEDALNFFSAPETLEGYRPSAAGKAEVVSASKSVKILDLSEIMILHLMRFCYGDEGSAKLHKSVHFPLELVFGRELLVSPSSEGRRYELVATVTHHGWEPSKGHYTADARHASGKWLRYDDASVTVIPISKVLHDQAYILFYKQL